MKESQKLYLITIETQEPGLMINWLYTHRFTYQIIYEPSTQIGIDITGMDDPRKGKNNGHSRKDVDGLERHYCGLELWLGTQQASDDTGDKPKDKLQRVSGSIHPFLGDSEFAILPEESVEILEAYLAGTIQPIRDEEDLKTPGHVSYKRSYVCDFKVKELTDKNHLKYE
ncbi:MAG: hypothetical protein QF824_03705, partial [Candidatus Woesearchaeota archaeon]|nr:hypothetical protein [Candidatus Woesearchaeota archaeon]